MQGQKSLLGFGLCQHISPGVRATTLGFPNCRLAACVSTACCPAKPHTHTHKYFCALYAQSLAQMMRTCWALSLSSFLFSTHTHKAYIPQLPGTHTRFGLGVLGRRSFEQYVHGWTFLVPLLNTSKSEEMEKRCFYIKDRTT